MVELMHIYDDFSQLTPYDEDYPTYEELGYTSVFKRMSIPHRLEEYVHHDPDFISFTFGDYPTRSRTSCLKDLDCLVKRVEGITYIALFFLHARWLN